MPRTKRGNPSPRSRASTFSVEDTEVYLSIYCSGVGKAEHNKWRITTLLPEKTGERTVWVVYRKGYIEPGSATLFPVAGDVVQRLVGDTWVPFGGKESYDSPDFRTRWNFKCHVCGVGPAISKKEDLYDAFTLAALTGTREFPLEHVLFREKGKRL